MSSLFSKIIEGTIINVVYVDKDGNVLGGGDYFVDADDDGIANYSELTYQKVMNDRNR